MDSGAARASGEPSTATRFMLTASHLDAVLQELLETTEDAQSRCVQELPEAERCRQDEFVSFDGTLTTIYEGEDMTTKQQRCEVPREPEVTAEDARDLRLEQLRLIKEKAQLERQRVAEGARMQVAEDERQDLRAKLEQKDISLVPSEASEVIQGPFPVEGVGILAERKTPEGAMVISTSELVKLSHSIAELEKRVEEERGKALIASGTADEAAEKVQEMEQLLGKRRKILGVDQGNDLLAAVQALKVTRMQQLADLQQRRQRKADDQNRSAADAGKDGRASPLQVHLGTDTPPLRPRLSSAAHPPAESAPSTQAPPPPSMSHGIRHPLQSGTDVLAETDPANSAAPFRGRRASHGARSAPPQNQHAEREEAKYKALSARIAELQRQYHDLCSESGRARDPRDATGCQSGGPPLRTSRSEAGLATAAAVVGSSAGGASGSSALPFEPLVSVNRRRRSPSCTSTRSASSPRSAASGQECLSPSHQADSAAAGIEAAVVSLLPGQAQQQPVVSSGGRHGGRRPPSFPTNDASHSPVTTSTTSRGAGALVLQQLPHSGRGAARSGRGNRDVQSTAPSREAKVSATAASGVKSHQAATARPRRRGPEQACAVAAASNMSSNASMSRMESRQPSQTALCVAKGHVQCQPSPECVAASTGTSSPVAPCLPGTAGTCIAGCSSATQSVQQSFAAAANAALGTLPLPPHLVAVPSSWEAFGLSSAGRQPSPEGVDFALSTSPTRQPTRVPPTLVATSQASPAAVPAGPASTLPDANVPRPGSQLGLVRTAGVVQQGQQRLPAAPVTVRGVGPRTLR